VTTVTCRDRGPDKAGPSSIFICGGELEKGHAALDKAIERLYTTRGIVVDIRDNRGGSDRGVRAIVDRFTDRRRLLMTSSVRSGGR